MPSFTFPIREDVRRCPEDVRTPRAIRCYFRFFVRSCLRAEACFPRARASVYIAAGYCWSRRKNTIFVFEMQPFCFFLFLGRFLPRHTSTETHTLCPARACLRPRTKAWWMPSQLSSRKPNIHQFNCCRSCDASGFFSTPEWRGQVRATVLRLLWLFREQNCQAYTLSSFCSSGPVCRTASAKTCRTKARYTAITAGSGATPATKYIFKPCSCALPVGCGNRGSASIARRTCLRACSGRRPAWVSWTMECVSFSTYCSSV